MPRLAWFPLYVDDWLGGTLAMLPAELGAYLSAILAQWQSGELQAIPDDPSRLMRICGGLDFTATVRAKFQSIEIDGIQYLRNKRLAGIWDKQKAVHEAQVAAGKQRAKQAGDLVANQAANLHKNPEPITQKRERKKAKPRSTEDITASQLGDSLEQPEGGESERGEIMPSWMDGFYEEFRRGWNATYPGQDYNDNRKGFDFVALAELQNNKSLNPENWIVACRNYFATPQHSHTLADLSKRYSGFLAHALDRFNKPVETNGKHSSTSRPDQIGAGPYPDPQSYRGANVKIIGEPPKRV